MAKYRLDALANLARQLSFTPLEIRASQVSAAEILLHDVGTEKAYPLDFIIYRITGYQPKIATGENADLFTGIALQHDLCLLIEQVSDTLILNTQNIAEPVLSIDDVTERFDVTSKTIQRWRRKGLAARRFVFADGKRRVGFLLSSVERFIAGHGDSANALCSTVQADEQAIIVRHARRLASHCCVDELCLRIGKKLHRSPLTILHTLKKHDAEHSASAVLPFTFATLSDEQRARIAREHKRGLTLATIAHRVDQPRSAVYRAVLHDRVDRLNRRKIRFIDDDLYHADDSSAAIDAIVAQQELPIEPNRAELRAPRDLPPYLGELYRVPLLSPARERALFLKFNFHKFQFITARRRLEPQFARARDLELLENHLRLATGSKNDILRANLRLVVSVARRHVRPSICLMELVSEGNITLMRAVEGFDVHKGNRFSTYATLALMKGFAQTVPQLLTGHKTVTDVEFLSNIADARYTDAIDRHTDREHIQHLLGRLDDRERRVLLAHYGLGPETAVPATYDQVAEQLGLSKQRVRQIEQRALAKLRE